MVFCRSTNYRKLLLIALSVMLIGCSADEVIMVGTPYIYKEIGGVKFDTEITNSEAISKLRTITDNSKEIEKPNGIENVVEMFFSLEFRFVLIFQIERHIGTVPLCNKKGIRLHA